MNKITIAFFVIFSQNGICNIDCHATSGRDPENITHEKLMKIHIGTPLKDGLNILQRNSNVLSIDLDTGDIDLSNLLKDSVIYIVTFKNSNDAIIILSDRENNNKNYIIKELMLYKNWRIDSTKPKKLRTEKIEHINSFPQA